MAVNPASPPNSRPDPAVAAPAAGEPAIDLIHLERQTAGDSALQQELLALFAAQLTSLPALASDGSAEPRRRAGAAHQLKGSALALGAGAVARAAAAAETALSDGAAAPGAVASALAQLSSAVAAARAALIRLRG